MWPEVLRADGASPVLKQSWARAKAPRGLRLVRKLRADEAPSARKTKRSRCNIGIALCSWYVALADVGPVVRGYG